MPDSSSSDSESPDSPDKVLTTPVKAGRGRGRGRGRGHRIGPRLTPKKSPKKAKRSTIFSGSDQNYIKKVAFNLNSEVPHGT